MSASEQSKSASPSSPAGVLPRQRRRRREGHWFLLSVTIHVLAFAALLYLTPVRELMQELRRPTRPEDTMSAAGLADLADSIERNAARRIALNADALANVSQKIGQIQSGIREEFSAFEQRRRESAARDALDEMEKALEGMDEAVTTIQEDASVEATDRLQAAIEHAQERAAGKLKLVQGNVSAVTAGQLAATEAHQQAKAAHDAHSTQKVRVARLQQALAKEQRGARQVRDGLEALKSQKKPARQVDKQAQRLAEQEQKVAAAREALDEARQQQEALRRLAAESQELARAAQKDVANALRNAIEQQGGGGAESASMAGLPQAPVQNAAPAPAPPDEAAMDLGQRYDQARKLEDSIAETFKEVRAMDLAMVRDIPIEQARGDIDLIRPVRPDLDVELLRQGARNEERFEAHKEEVRTALRETSSMVNLAQRMLEMASESVEKMKFGTDVELAPEEEGAVDFRLVIRELAREDVAGRFSDLAAAMQALDQQQAAGGGGAAGRPGVDYQDLTAEELAALGRLPLFGDQGAQDEAGAPLPELTPEMVTVGTRKLDAAGQPAEWVYIDTWYTIGPFPNPKRINIDREFPPDSLVDLDATYVGKGGRTIRWQFVQSDQPQVVPPNAEPYGIWYAYTEFYCDQPQDVLIAMGSDDRGNLKINGVPVWISSKQLKGWSVDEVWRRVHFTQGVNRILYRVENGWQATGFSLVLRLDEP